MYAFSDLGNIKKKILSNKKERETDKKVGDEGSCVEEDGETSAKETDG